MGYGISISKANQLAYGIPSPYCEEANLYFTKCALRGFPVTEEYKVRYNNFITDLKITGDWNNADSIYVWATGNEGWARVDIRNPKRTVDTFQGSYAGRWTINKGWNGNASFALLTGFNPGDGGEYNFKRNNASIGCLLLDNDSVASKHEISSMNAGNNTGIIIVGYNPTDRGSVNTIIPPATGYNKYRFNSYCWKGATRTASNIGNMFVNGVNQQTQTSESLNIENKQIAVMGAYNGSFLAGFYTSNSHAVFYAGGGSLSQKNIMNAYNSAFNYGNVTNINKRVIFEGDSRTGSISSPALSNNSRYPKQVLIGLGSGWSGVVVSEANETVASMIPQFIDEIHPYRNSNLVKDVIVLFAGTNDIAGGDSAATLFSNIKTLAQSYKNDGFKVIIVGEIDRNWSSYAAMNTVRNSLQTSMLSDFTTASGITNVWGTNSVSYADYYIQLHAEVNFQSYLSANYQADGIHPSTVGSDVIANTYVYPTIQLL